MSEPQDPYAGQPYYGQQPAPYQQQYPQQYEQPYAQQYPQPYGQYLPHPGYPYGAYPYPPRPGRPGTATASAVLAYVAAGLLILAALILFTGASIIHDIGNSVGSNTDPTTTELSLDGVVNLISAALLISGGVMFAGRNPRGRALLSTGGCIVVACSIYWIARFDTYGATVFYGLLFASLVIIAMSMAYTAGSRAWLMGTTPAPA